MKKLKVSAKKTNSIFSLVDELNTKLCNKIKPGWFATQFNERTSLKPESLNRDYFDLFEDDNFHALNGFLYVNGYFNFKLGASHEFMLKEYSHFIVENTPIDMAIC